MPWTAGDAERHIAGLTPTQSEAWAKIANSTLAECQKKGEDDCEGKAIRVANAGAKRVGKIAKLDESRHLAFGWAYVAKQRDGTQVLDHSGEYVDDVTVLEDAMYEYVETSRETNDMHDGPITGHLVESFVVTPDKLEAMGLQKDALPAGVWVGFRLEPEAFDKVRSGERRAFSIEGLAVKVEE